jgi:hypothetical protein
MVTAMVSVWMMSEDPRDSALAHNEPTALGLEGFVTSQRRVDRAKNA